MYRKIIAPLLLALSASGCYVSTVEEPETDSTYDRWDDSQYDQWNDTTYVSWINADAKKCTTSSSYYQRYRAMTATSKSEYATSETNCYEYNNHQWRNKCDSGYCNKLDIYTHYMLPQDIGDNLTVYIEAFDNSYFHGYPKASVQVTGFDAKQGNWQKTELFVDEGEYYLRAYVTNTDDQILPYRLGNLEVIADEPIGTFGALSSPQRVLVDGATHDPINIYLDRIFRSPDSELDTDAFLRLSLATEGEVEDNRQVIVQLRQAQSLEANPAQQFSLPSSEFLVVGREGTAEYLTPELPLGDYYLFVFLDGNSNGFYDQGELAAMELFQGQPKRISLIKEHTLSLSLILASDWEVTEP